MAYDPNQAGLFNKLIQSGLNTANAALQAGITSTKDFALGNNGNLGGLIPGANAVPGIGDTFQNVNFAQTVSGQPTQLAAAAIGAAPLFTPQTIEIQPSPVAGLDLTATSPFAAFNQAQAVPRPTLAAEAAPSPTAFSATDPRVTVFGPPPIVSTVPDNIPRVEVNGVGQVPTTDTGFIQAPGELGRGTAAPEVVTAAQLGTQAFPTTVNPALAEPAPILNIQAPGELGRGTAAPEPQPAILNVQAPGELGRGTVAPDPQPTIYNVQAPGELGRGTAAPETVNANTAGLPILNEEGQVAQGIRMNPETGETYYTEPPFDPANQSQAETNRLANQQAAAEANTVQQAARQATFKQPGNGDWRFRISLAEGANYLYGIINNSERGGGAGAANAGPGILAPLANTGGVIFPYTPQVTSSYQAKYSTYDLVHSNYRGAFYQNSYVSDIQIRGVFTAQDTTEAKYLLAVIHFFRSVTKMFYGQDAQRGAPPPLVFLTGLGDFQYNKHPAVVTQFDYTLPNDVDYIRADNPNNFGTDLLNRRTPTQSTPSGPLGAALNRLGLSGLFPGATPSKPAPVPITNSVTNTARATYVPTKIEISLTLMPMQTRDQVSKLFSLKDFANGNLIRGGFW